MGIKTQKILRLISKLVLALVALGLIGFAGYYVYRSITFKPQNIVVTNITDSSATITWATSSPMKGVVYSKKDKGLLPGPLGIIGSSIAYDDRDVSDAQTSCVEVFNKKASTSKDSSFSVSGSNFDCENAKVTKTGSYYTHSVTITNLDENSAYNFVVGDGIWSFKGGISTVKTFTVLETIGEPKPIFGKVVGDDDTYSRDALVYVTFNDGSENKDSIVYSSITNDDGGWYLDASNVRDVSGNVLPLELTNDTFKVKGIYSNYGVGEEEKYILGYFNGAYPDIVVKKSTTSVSWLNSLMGKAYATYITATNCTGSCAQIVEACPKCANSLTVEQINTIAQETANGTSATLAGLASTLGTGNAAKISASLNDGVVDFGEVGVTKNYGNINSLVGATVTTSDNVDNVTVSYSGGAVSATATIKEVGTYYSETTTCTNNGCSAPTTIYDAPGGNVGTGEEDPVPNTCDGHAVGACQNLSSYGSRVCTSSGWSEQSGICGTNTSPSTTNPCGGSAIGSCQNLSSYGSRVCTASGWSEQSGVCSTQDSTPTTTTTDCTVKVEYYNTGDISSCDIVCGSGTVSLSNADKCQRVAPSIAPTIVSDGSGYQTRELPVLATEIDPYILSVSRIETLVNASEAVRTDALNEMAETEGLTPPWSNTVRDTYEKICDATGGTATRVFNLSYEAISATCSYSSSSNILGVSKVYAADNASSQYSYYLPELGLYNFEVDGTVLSTQVSNGEAINLFYIEANDKSGFQMPADPDNPTKDEDILLSTNALEITYDQESSAQQYEIKKGINIVSFDFVPVSTDLGAYTAEDVIKQAFKDNVSIQYISTFDGGRWNSGYSCSSDTCTGDNFTIIPGKGYLIYATDKGSITIPGYNLASSIPVAFSAGWNLVGVHGYTKAYTARSFMDSINKVSGLTADNVSWWPTSKSKYEGLSLEEGVQYGTDFAMSSTNGYFVRISKFAPTDTKCKSLIWNEGGSLNGSCGNSK